MNSKSHTKKYLILAIFGSLLAIFSIKLFKYNAFLGGFCSGLGAVLAVGSILLMLNNRNKK